MFLHARHITRTEKPRRHEESRRRTKQVLYKISSCSFVFFVPSWFSLKTRNRDFRGAERAGGRFEVFRGFVFGEGEIRHAEVGDRLEPIVNLHGRDDGAARLLDER